MSILDLRLDVVELTRMLCDIPSVSGEEASVADSIITALSDAKHLELIRNGNTIVARTDLGRRNRVIIAGHLDTVPVNANLPSRIEKATDGSAVLWGRGTVDMKSGVAVQLKLAAELTQPTYDITWIWYDNEEVSSSRNGLRRLAEQRPDLFTGDFAILGEPTSCEIEGGCNGTLRAEIRTTGKRAHSARSWMGDNAIHKLPLARLAEYVPAVVNVDGLDYREGLNAVRVSGGVAGNVIPDEAVLEVNYRYAPSRTADEAAAYIKSFFIGYTVEIVDNAEGARPGLTTETIREFVKTMGVAAKPKYGWTDVARFSALGIPAVNYGPGDPSLAHADDERVPCAQIEQCERALRSWLSESS